MNTARPPQEPAAPARAVGDAAGAEQQGAEHDAVGRQHPRQRAWSTRPGTTPDRREGHVHDREVEGHHEGAGDRHRGTPATGSRRRRRRKGGLRHATQPSHIRVSSCNPDLYDAGCADGLVRGHELLDRPVARGDRRVVDAAHPPRRLPRRHPLRRLRQRASASPATCSPRGSTRSSTTACSSGVPYDEARGRYDYVLTDKGRALWPVMTASASGATSGSSARTTHRSCCEHTTCGEISKGVLTCDHCGEELTSRTLRARRGPGATDDSLLPAG